MNFEGEFLDSLLEPEVASGGFLDHIERPKLPAELDDLIVLIAVKR